MTFVNHTIGGMAVGSAISYLLFILFGINFWWLLVILNSLIGVFPDASDWVAWKFFGRNKWEWGGLCHPPYDRATGHGKIDRFMKWFPSWGLHTWVTDSIVHPDQPKFIFPKFPVEWANIIWIRIWPIHWNIEWTKWDIFHVLLELVITIIYVIIILCTII